MKISLKTLTVVLASALLLATPAAAQTDAAVISSAAGIPMPGTPSYVAPRTAASRPPSAPSAPPQPARPAAAALANAPKRITAESLSGRTPARILVPEASADGSWGPVNYAYDGVGNITGIGSNYYVYDGVSRLVKASTNSVVQSFAYDRFGNITSMDDSATTLAVEPSSNRLTSVTKGTKVSPSLSYDAAGNLTFDGVTSYTYDALGTMTSAHDDYYLYDADDERIATLGLDGVNRYTLRGLDQKVLREIVDEPAHGKRWNWSKDYVYRGGQLLAEVTPTPGVEAHLHYHLDHLGSPRMITDESTPPLRLSYHDYYPFGGDTADSTPDQERLRFTGHERDLKTPGVMLDYMHARYYAGAWGRFLSIDPVPGRQSQPQSWNRYAYVHNDPMVLEDPTGRAEDRKIDLDDLAFVMVIAQIAGPFAVVDQLGEMTDGAGLASKNLTAHTKFAAYAAKNPVKFEGGGLQEDYITELCVAQGAMAFAEAVGPYIEAFPYPPSGGFVTTTPTVLQPGLQLDRFGELSGTYASRAGTEFSGRSLSDSAAAGRYTLFEVQKPIMTRVGPARPWFGQDGMELQYQFPKPISDLVNDGTLKVLGTLRLGVR